METGQSETRRQRFPIRAREEEDDLPELQSRDSRHNQNQEYIRKNQEKLQQYKDRVRQCPYHRYFPVTADLEPSRAPGIIEERKDRQTRVDEDILSVDNYPVGDSMDYKPDDDDTRIFFQNVNGISSRDEWQDASEIGYMARQQYVSILAMAETKVDWKKGRAKKACLKNLKAFWTAAKIGTACSMIDFDSVFHPGGVMQLVGNEWSSRVTRTNEDPRKMGRWISMTLQGKAQKALTLITAYQVVNDSSALHRPKTAYKQQWMMLRTTGEPNPKPREAFVRDLKDFITKEREHNNDVMVMLDANENLTKSNSPLGRALMEIGLVNVYQHVHAKYDELAEEPATYNRGSQCIDFIYASTGILPYVKKCGMTAFQEGVAFSDHRGLFVDLELKAFLGKPQMLLPQGVRGMRCNNPTSCKKYSPEVIRYFVDHKVEERSMSMTTPRKIEGVDKDITRAMLHAENKHGNKFAIPWSPKLIQAKMLVRYWLLWLSEIKTKRDLQLQKLALVQDLKVRPEEADCYRGEVSFVVARRRHKEATKSVKNIVADASKHRDDLLKERIEAAYLYDTGESGNEWTGIFDQEEIVQRLMDRNRKHFGQAQGTPFTVGPLQGLFEWSGNTEAGDKVIDGTFRVPPGIDEATQCVLEYLTETEALPIVNDTVNENDIRQGFKRWKEGTSTSRDRHLGLYKALMAYEVQSYDDERQEIPKISTRVYTVLASVINCAKEQGHVLHRWKHVTNVMLEKLPGTPRIDKLRVIHLFEADFNLYLGIMWGRRMMWNAEDHSYLSGEQWGSRAGRMCSDVVLLKHFTYLVSHLTRTTIGAFDNDAKSCYDRIVVNLAMLISRTMGMSRDAAGLHAEFLRQAEYHLKTNLGITDEFYSNLMDIIHGTGQGSRASPAFWAIISSVIIRLVQKKSDGVYVGSPDLETSIRRWMDGFVDDTSKWINQFIEELLDEFAEEDRSSGIVEDLRVSAQWWEELLYSTGGQLELSKCLYYVMSWEFDEEGKPSLRSRDSIPAEQIEIQSSAGLGSAAIRHFDCLQSHKTLGVMENPALVYDDEYARLENKVTALTRHLQVDPLYPGDAVTMYNSIMLPSVGYSLAIMSFSRKKMDALNSRVIAMLLIQMGYHRKTPHAVVFGPEHYGGLGMQSFYVKMGTDKVLALLRNVRHFEEVGKIMQICMNWFQMIAGYSYDCFQVTQTAIPHMVGDWLKHLRDFLAVSELYIRMTQPLYAVTKEGRRKGDRVLMEEALRRNTAAEIKLINRVRIYLRVETLSDCANAAGTHLLRAVVDRKSNRESMESFPTRFWPRQACPGPKSWSCWRTFIRHYTVDPLPGSTMIRKLTEPLGPWTDTSNRRWKWSIDWMANQVVETVRITPIEFSYTSYPITAATRRAVTFDQTPCEDIQYTPEQLVPVSWVKGYAVTPPAPHCNPHVAVAVRHAITFDAFVVSLPKWERQLLEGNSEGTPGALFEWLASYTGQDSESLLLCHDGGEKNNYGSFGWVISDGVNILWKGWGPAVGNPMQSFRAEAYGRLAAVSFLRRFTEFYAIDLPIYDTVEERKIAMALCYTDSQSLLDRLVEHATRHVNSSFDRMKNDSDVIFEIAAVEKAAGLQMKGAWVKGHQDDHHDYNELPLEAKLNVIADELATAALEQHMENETPLPMEPLPSTKVYLCTVEGNMMTSREKRLIQQRLPETEMRDFLMDKYDWDIPTWKQIAWDSFRIARNTVQPGRKGRKGMAKFVTKWTSKWLAVGRRTSRYSGTDDVCPLCKEEEDYDHLVNCSQRDEWRKCFIEKLDQYLKHQHTEPAVRVMIRDGFKDWMDAIPHELSDFKQSTARNLTWHHAARGYFDKNWAEAQEWYFRTLEAQHRREFPDSTKPKFLMKEGYTGIRWLAKLIGFIWTGIHDGWSKRNVVVHGPGIQSEREREKLELSVETLYNLSEHLGHHDRELFDQPKERILELRTADLKIWVRDTQQVVKLGLRDAREQAKHGVQDIRNFFTVVSTEEPSDEPEDDGANSAEAAPD